MGKWRTKGKKTMDGRKDEEQKRPMLADDSEEEDPYLRPSLRYALIEEKRHYRCMAVMTATSFLFLLSLGICFIVLFKNYSLACPVCQSVVSSMDQSVDPCEDFYQYSCGNWVKTVRVPAGHSKWGSFGQVYSEIKLLLKKVLEEDGSEYAGRTSTALKKAKDYYLACMNEAAREEAGSRPLKQFLNQLGGWSMMPENTPGLKNWDGDDFDLTQAIIAAHENGADPLFDMSISPDSKNSSVNIIEFIQSGVGFSATELYNDNDTTHEEAYASLGAQIVVLLSLAENESITVEEITKHANYEPALQRMRDIVEFEADISRLYVPKEDLIDPVESYNKITVRELAKIIPQINISLYLHELLSTEVPPDELVLVPVQAYLESLNELLIHTPKRLLADYITWFIVKTNLAYMPKIYVDLVREYGSLFSGSNTTSPLWEKCIKRTDIVMGYVTGALFVREIVTPQLRNETWDLIEYIRDAFVDNLPKVEWMDDETKSAAREKALAMRNKIGFPAWIEDPVQLDEYYQMVNISNTSSFENFHSIHAFNLNLGRQKYGKPVSRDAWHMAPAEVNAYYSTAFNEIVFPLGILQPPYYDSAHPMSMNFGAIGMVMGHELTHGFDDRGREFDKDGNLKNWWGNSSEMAYENKTECIIDQYSAYKIGENNLDGEYTLSENIADNGGVKIAYLAYQKWKKSHNDTRKLDSLGLSHDQLFFLGFSQIWCTYITPQEAEMSILTDQHAAEHFRVNGVVSNMPEFSVAYSCPLGSPMNPEKKCRVW